MKKCECFQPKDTLPFRFVRMKATKQLLQYSGSYSAIMRAACTEIDWDDTREARFVSITKQMIHDFAILL